jgi:hypothetical protein
METLLFTLKLPAINYSLTIMIKILSCQIASGNIIWRKSLCVFSVLMFLKAGALSSTFEGGVLAGRALL